MADNRSHSVLIVDDELDAGENLRDILTDLDYRVDTARSGIEAIEKVRCSSFEVVLLDLKMPGMDGVAVYREIKLLNPETAVIVVSAFSGSDLAEAAVDEGAVHVISKPVDVPALLAAIDASLAQPLILVVDDDVSFCQNLWQILTRRGYRLALTHSPAQARQQLGTKAFDIVIIDFKLSETETANDVIRAVGDTNPRARRILVTGCYDVVGAVGDLVGRGIDAACYKPVDIEALLGILRG